MNPFIDSELLISKKSYVQADTGKHILFYIDKPAPVSIYPLGMKAIHEVASKNRGNFQLLMHILNKLRENSDVFTLEKLEVSTVFSWAEKTAYNRISDLLRAGIMAQVPGVRRDYFINLKMFFRGNRAKFVFSTYDNINSNSSGHLFFGNTVPGKQTIIKHETDAVTGENGRKAGQAPEGRCSKPEQ